MNKASEKRSSLIELARERSADLHGHQFTLSNLDRIPLEIKCLP